MSRGNSFSIIIPVHNEEPFLRKSVLNLIEEIKSKKSLTPFNYEIILIENGSADRSFWECQDLKKRYSFIKTYQLNFASYGQALKKGIFKARYPLVVVFNVDFWDINFLEKGLKLIKTHDLVIASKTLIPGDDQRPLNRRLATYFFNLFLKVAFKFPGTDTHGLKVMKKEKILPLVKNCHARYELFDTELVLRAYKKGLAVKELPVSSKEVRPSRYFGLRRTRNVLKDLFIFLKFQYGRKKCR